MSEETTDFSWQGKWLQDNAATLSFANSETLIEIGEDFEALKAQLAAAEEKAAEALLKLSKSNDAWLREKEKRQAAEQALAQEPE